MKSFFKFLSRNVLYTFIELFSLSIAIGFIILLATYANTEYNIGNRQPRSKEIYSIGTGVFVGMTLETIPTLGGSIPEIASFTRVEGEFRVGMLKDENYYEAKGILVDTNFFDLFEYRLDGVNKNQIFHSKDEIILSNSFARNMFGNENPVGKSIKVVSGLSFNNLAVIGTIEDFGQYDIFESVDFLCSIKNSTSQPMDNFGNISTFITLAEGASPEEVNQKLLDEYIKYWSWFAEDGSKGGLLWGSSLTRLDKLYFSPLEKYTPIRSGNERQVFILLIVGLVLLVSAIFNYINLSVAQTGKRAKEMATRRLLGSSRSQIIWRYLSESFLFTTGCFLIGCFLAYSFLPLFDRILQTDIVLVPEVSSILVCVLTLIVISVISGILPALIVSKYKPVDVVKGNFGFHSKMGFGQVFIFVQNLISVILLAVAFAMILQVQYLVNLPLGYKTKDLIEVRVWDVNTSSKKMILRDKIKELPMVEDVAMCGQLPSLCGFNGVPLDNGNVFLTMPTLDTIAFKMFGFNVLERFSDPVGEKVWLTRKAQGLFNATKDKPKIGIDSRYEVCGVIEDYHARDAIFDHGMDNVYNSVKMISDDYPYVGSLVVKITGDQDRALEAVREVCEQTSAEIFGVKKSMKVRYIDDYLYEQLLGKRNIMSLVIVFMIVSVLISALGLFAMSVYFTQQQSRQIAVRKVFGSTIGQESNRLSSRFLIISAVAAIISIPISVYLIRFYLQSFINRIDFPVIAIIAAFIFSLIISFLSVYGTSRSSAMKNPVDTLKKE